MRFAPQQQHNFGAPWKFLPSQVISSLVMTIIVECRLGAMTLFPLTRIAPFGSSFGGKRDTASWVVFVFSSELW